MQNGLSTTLFKKAEVVQHLTTTGSQKYLLISDNMRKWMDNWVKTESFLLKFLLGLDCLTSNSLEDYQCLLLFQVIYTLSTVCMCVCHAWYFLYHIPLLCVVPFLYHVNMCFYHFKLFEISALPSALQRGWHINNTHKYLLNKNNYCKEISYFLKYILF